MPVSTTNPVETAFGNFGTACTSLQNHLLNQGSPTDFDLVGAMDAMGSGLNQAVLHRDALKTAAKYHAVGDNASADAWRQVAKVQGDEAADRLDDASVLLDTLRNTLTQMIDNTSLSNYVSSGEFAAARQRTMKRIVAPKLVGSTLSPEQISYIWRDINNFLDNFAQAAGTGGFEGVQGNVPLPDLGAAAADLRGVDYNDASWSYCDRTHGEPAQEPIPAWKDIIIKVGRWVAVAVAVAMAIILCQWEILFAVVTKWMEVEEVVREFCGWICA